MTEQLEFQSCIDDCDSRCKINCDSVTYTSSGEDANSCFLRPNTAVLRAANDTQWSAVRLPGPEGLTCPEANGIIYTDAVYTDASVDQYHIICGSKLVDAENGTVTKQPSCQACINYCHEDPDCGGVTWRPSGEEVRGRFRKSINAVAQVAAMNFWSAQKIYDDGGDGTVEAVSDEA